MAESSLSGGEQHTVEVYIMLLAIILIATFTISMIAAGYGILPMGMVLFIDMNSLWGLLGWGSIIYLAISTIVCRNEIFKRYSNQFFAAIGLYVTWIGLAIKYSHVYGGPFWKNIFGHILFSIPFQVTFVVLCVLYYRKRNIEEKGKTNSLNHAASKGTPLSPP